MQLSSWWFLLSCLLVIFCASGQSTEVNVLCPVLTAYALELVIQVSKGVATRRLLHHLLLVISEAFHDILLVHEFCSFYLHFQVFIYVRIQIIVFYINVQNRFLYYFLLLKYWLGFYCCQSGFFLLLLFSKLFHVHLLKLLWEVKLGLCLWDHWVIESWKFWVVHELRTWRRWTIGLVGVVILVLWTRLGEKVELISIIAHWRSRSLFSQFPHFDIKDAHWHVHSIFFVCQHRCKVNTDYLGLALVVLASVRVDLSHVSMRPIELADVDKVVFWIMNVSWWLSLLMFLWLIKLIQDHLLLAARHLIELFLESRSL